MPQYRQEVSQESHSGAFSLSTNYTATQSNLSIVTNPGRHQSIVVTDLIASAATAGYLTLEQDTQVQQTVITQRLNLAANGLITANYNNGLRLTPNTNLGLNASTDDFSLTLEGYIENVITYGYLSGGGISSWYKSLIQKFSFAANSNAVTVGDLTLARGQAAGQSSTISGYTSGGQDYGVFWGVDRIDKFSFSSDGDSTDVGNLTGARGALAGQSSSTDGYSAGGIDYPSGSPIIEYATIDKFSFTSDGNATSVGDLSGKRILLCGQWSASHGYTSGGTDDRNDKQTTVDKFSFASDGDATAVANLTTAVSKMAGNSSPTHGYTSGGQTDSFRQWAQIEQFSFASDGDGAEVGELTLARLYLAGTSSATDGFVGGGFIDNYAPVPDVYGVNTIDKYSFASGGKSVDSGDLVTASFMYSAAGQQS